VFVINAVPLAGVFYWRWLAAKQGRESGERFLKKGIDKAGRFRYIADSAAGNGQGKAGL
jgi:hypothetical protein